MGYLSIHFFRKDPCIIKNPIIFSTSLVPGRNRDTGIFFTIAVYLAYFWLLLYIVSMSVRMRHTKSHSHNRRSHHAIVSPKLIACEKCHTPKLPHRVCKTCGTYAKREVVDVLAKLTKKERKEKEKELKAKEAEEPAVS